MNDIIVVGGGIGGLLLTQNLLKHNWTVTVVDANHSMRGSGSPRAIMHAFPGRSFQPHPLLKAAFLISREQMEIWQRADDSLVTHCEMIRPLQGQSGKRLQKSFKKYWANSADNWIHFSQNKASEGDAIHYTPAYAVNLYAACSHLKKELQTSGVRFITDHVIELCPIKDGWMTIGKNRD